MRWVLHELAIGRFNTEQIWKMAKKKGFRCSKSNFWRSIRNPVYCGKIIVPKHKEEEAYLVEGKHEPLITEDLFYKVQDILDGRKNMVRTKIYIDENLPLRGFLICPRCERILTGSASKGRNRHYHYYHCTPSCGYRHRASDLNIKIVEELKRYVRPLGEVQIYKDIITGIFQARTRDQEEFREQLKFKLEVSHRRMSKARDLLLDGKIEADDYRIIKIECEKAIRRLEAKLTATAGQKLDIKNLLNNALKN